MLDHDNFCKREQAEKRDPALAVLLIAGADL